MFWVLKRTVSTSVTVTLDILHSSPYFYLVNLQHPSNKHVFDSTSCIVKNSVDIDQVAISELNLHCFQRRINPGSAAQGSIVKNGTSGLI